MDKGIVVIKKNGEAEPYSREKVIHSMQRVGVPQELQEKALVHIEEKLHGEVSTHEIFTHILEFLEKEDTKSSLKFNLRQAVFELGPTGFPFERFLARIFIHEGYKTTVDVPMRGECVTHEIDLVLEKNGKKEIVEAKFHNQQVGKTDVQVMLYMYARYLDVKTKNDISDVWVITNTKLTTDAISYARCKNMKILAWNYPEEKSLQAFVESPKMYPVTILPSLTLGEKQRLLQNNIILSCDLLDHSENDLIEKYQLDSGRLTEALSGARTICK